MPFYIVHVSGPAARKRAIADRRGFETPGAAEEVARQRWPEGGYFIVEAEDEDSAGGRAIEESRALD
jgi:hypothetical protein